MKKNNERNFIRRLGKGRTANLPRPSRAYPKEESSRESVNVSIDACLFAERWVYPDGKRT